MSQNELDEDGAFDFQFTERLCRLIAMRPHVCSDSMNCNAELQTLVLSEVTSAFDEAIKSSNSCGNSKLSVSMRVLTEGGGSSTKTIVVSLSLIRAAVVVVSDWKDIGGTMCNTDSGNGVHTAANLFWRLLRYIVPAPDLYKKSLSGLASAVYNETNTRVASVEDVSRVR